VVFAFGYDLAREQAGNGLLDFLGIFSRIDLGFRDYDDLFCFRIV
jgi:hypothetical protein